MPPIPNHKLNGFASALTRRFREAAKGLDAESMRFLKARPAERVLCGFLTPSGSDSSDDTGGSDIATNLEADESYEQTHVGFEWAVPKSAVGRGYRIPVRIGAAVYARVYPTFDEVRPNTRLDRHGSASLLEVWQRYMLAGSDQPWLETVLDLDPIVDTGAWVTDLSVQAAAAWSRIETIEPTLFQGRRERRLTGADIASEDNYRSWLSGLVAPARQRACIWKLRIDARAFNSPTDPEVVRVLVRLVNASETVDRPASAFADPRLYAVAMQAHMPVQAHQPSEFRVLPNSYRYDRRVDAIGINSQPEVSRSEGTLKVNVETVPITPSPRIVPRDIAGGIPEFVALADEDRCLRVLETILESMTAYDENAWTAKINELVAPEERADAESTRAAFNDEIAAYRAGVELLRSAPHGPEARAFRLMNRTMQRAGAGRRVPVTKWHLFQIVFIVSHLSKLRALAAGEPVRQDLNILWFPAGGGKTEAFLGLLVWHAFYDRLRGKDFGITAFLRYPLRLLTYQQLQRVVWVMGQAEEVRGQHNIGGLPFSVGYYVGESTTPNSISDELHRKLNAAPVPREWQRVFRCPSCGRRDIGLRYISDLRLVEHYCLSPGCNTQGARLPIYIIDADLYRYLPTVIVSTVDKLAQLGQNRRFSQLLGRVELFCPLHGAAFRGSNKTLCVASSEADAGRVVAECGGAAVRRGPFPGLGPSLHVQDEMHLLRESLATFDSHYETSALALQRSFSEGMPGWYLIGATATIEGYREQAAHLYLRESLRFPAPGPEAYESFYYTVDPTLRGRLYVGVLGVGRTHTPAVARTIALLYAVVEKSRTLARTDINAARSYLDLDDLTAAEVEALAFLYEIILTYVLTRKGGDQVSEAIDTRVRRDVEQAGGGNLRVETFNSSVDMPRMISTMEEIETATVETALGDRVRGVVATNIISHGVDIDRFNIMVFAGLPRQFAEYIQASARVGRQIPGISLLVVTPQSDRDRSVFDRFEKFHQYVDRLVEPVPINRWSEPALEMTLRGILAGYLMGAAPVRLGREVYLVRHVKSLYGGRNADALREQVVVDWVAEAVGANHPNAPQYFTEAVLAITRRLYGLVTGASPDRDREPINSYLDSMRSLRDIDDPAWIRVNRDSDVEILRAVGI